ncbi:hypothetical protein UO65_4397 [Actinokineospora spheciospongiae]|uniref:DUF5753 domain-containing protein n=1 Tax=Actinokineospora spheciospongiae TaxID=909613 RepID=W7J2D2_9PSEU|nr:Scr1 family TA system antitoxin-like transcriptional regulator [Actinokineospora spheciospongiae]EWC60289.1 hypothetical protein UO65_4397 [Actinokineospora spheciospongiae]
MAARTPEPDFRARTVRALLLSRELDHNRRRVGLSTRQAASGMDMSPAMLNRVMTGRRLPTALEVGGLCALFDVPAERRPVLYALAREGDRTQWLTHHDPGDPDRFAVLRELHAVAESITGYDTATLPLALRTADYHRAVLAATGAAPTARGPDRVEAYTAHYVHAHALRAPWVDPAVMTAQLARLRDDRRLRVLPDRTPPPAAHPFQVITTRHFPPVVFFDLGAATLLLELDAAAPHLAALRAVERGALSVGETRAFLDDLLFSR